MKLKVVDGTDKSGGEPTPSTPGRDQLAKTRIAIAGIEEHTLIALAQLADAGIGFIKLIDHRHVTAEDISRAFFFFQKHEENQPRTSAARNLIYRENKTTKVEVVEQKFDAHSAEELLGEVDVVIDGLSDWQDKLLASDVCMHLKTPLVHAGLSGLDIQVYCMIPTRSACLRCVFAKLGMEDFAATTSATNNNGRPHLGPLAAIAGSLQALECIKLLGGIGTVSPTRLMKIDGLRGDMLDFRELAPRSDCPDCGPPRF